MEMPGLNRDSIYNASHRGAASPTAVDPVIKPRDDVEDGVRGILIPYTITTTISIYFILSFHAKHLILLIIKLPDQEVHQQ